MTRHYKNYTDKDITEKASQVKSLAGLLKGLGLQPVGGNYMTLKRKLRRLSVDCSHWTGKAWNKGQRLKNWSNFTRTNRLKKHLIQLRGHRCEVCKNTQWLDKLMPLELHHKDGEHSNNALENLQLICPNCHTFTDSYRGKKLSARFEKNEVELVKVGEAFTGNTEPNAGNCEGVET